MNEINKNEKEFQQHSTEYIYKRLFSDKQNSPRRFLLADEVGLGKTIVAKSVIKKIFESGKGKINILYICSNQELARQNVVKLKPNKSVKPVEGSRLTLLIPKLYNEKKLDNKIKHFIISLTPGTSIEIKTTTGQKDERKFLYYLLLRIYGIKDSNKIYFLREYFKCNVKNICDWLYAGWQEYREDASKNEMISKEFRKKVKDAWDSINIIKELSLSGKYDNKKYNFRGFVLGLARDFSNDNNVTNKKLRNKLIGLLRCELAKVTVDYLDPKLIILDEFQRFRTILKDIKPNSLQEKILSNKDVPILMLSATPYKMYTMIEEGTHHCEELKETLKFLYGESSADRVSNLDGLFNKYINSLKDFVQKDERTIKEDIDRPLLGVKNKIEHELKKVMLRIERRIFFEDCNESIDAKLKSSPVNESELKEFMILTDMIDGTTVSRHSLLEYWKSDDHLLNFMDKEYELIRKVKKTKIKKAFALLRQRGLAFSKQDIKRYRSLCIQNFKLRKLTEQIMPDMVKTKALWLAPTYKYYKYANASKCGDICPSKYLIFSNWRFVPKAISMLLSYEVERMLIGKKYRNYYDEQKRKPLLIFRSSKKKKKKLETYSILNIFYPCLFFASKVNHLKLRLDSEKDLNYITMLKKTVAYLSEELKELGIHILPEARSREKGMTAFDMMLFIDHQYLSKEKKAASGFIMAAFKDAATIIKKTNRTEGIFVEYVKDIEYKLKTMPQEMVISEHDMELLADIALSSPSICLMRTAMGLFLESSSLKKEFIYSKILKISLSSVRSYFNKYWVKEVIDSDIKNVGSRYAYWKKIIKYCAKNHFQEVIDEYGFMVKKSQHAEEEDGVKEFEGFIGDFEKALGIQVGTPTYYDGTSSKSGIRCHFAMRFGDEVVEKNGGVIRGPQVREAFNSPFWPFVLATTSIGQEGLDFHRYCKDVVHWNLPSNPVDLEQREGRVNRYNSITIRKNIERDFSLVQILKDGTVDNVNFWGHIFNYVENNTDVENILKKGIAPNWIYSGPQKINRHLYFCDFSRDHEKYKQLKEHLTYYRLAFGQPRQDDLVDYLASKMRNKKDIGRYLPIYMINLAPDFSKGVKKRAMKYANAWIGDRKKVKKLIKEARIKLCIAKKVHPDIESHFKRMLDYLKEWTCQENPFITDWEAKRIMAGLVYLLDPFDECCDYYRQTAYKDDVKFIETIEEKIKERKGNN